ncbi:unnamed protein product [Rotaria sordida]|uniref:Uncharacterized protein n=1 Tax=Rotaria sordida TaxID=392033 RepID=A0A814SP59_9BILA|nr:unnamed protein product [Rotaria sordida]
MSSSSSSTLLPSNTEEDLASESVQSSASERHQEVEDVASSTNVNVQSNSSVINDSSNDNLLPANTFSPIEQPSDNDYQVSISVDDETNALLNQGHSTVNKILELKADETLSRSNPIDQAVLPTIINNISDNSATTDNGGTEPHNTLTTQSQTSAITEENSQKQFPNQKHIMISYNQATASDVCLKIYNDLKSSVIDDEQQQENDNDHLIQHLLQCNERLAENIRIQQENYINTQQYLLDQNERLAAFIRFQQRQDQNNAHLLQRHFNQNDELISIVRTQQEQQQFSNQNKQLAQITRKQQEQERNYHISEQLLQRVDQLTQLLVNQQQQHSRDIEALHQLINRSFERNESLQTTIDQRLTPQDRQEHKEGRFYLNFDTLSKLVQTIILLWTLIILLRNT